MTADAGSDAAIIEAAAIIATTLRQYPSLLPLVEAACTAVAAILKDPKIGDDVAIALMGTHHPTLIAIAHGIGEIVAEVQVLHGEHERDRAH